MNYFVVNEDKNSDYWGLEDVYESSDVLVSPNIRQRLGKYLQYYPNISRGLKEYFSYEWDPQIPWYGTILGNVFCHRLSRLHCKKCGCDIYSDRILPFQIPKKFNRLLDEDRVYNTCGDFLEDVEPLERYLQKKGIVVKFRPGDIFTPLEWKNPLRWNERKIFGPIHRIDGLYRNCQGIIVESNAFRVIQNNIGVRELKLVPLAATSIFNEKIDKSYILILPQSSDIRITTLDDIESSEGNIVRCDNCLMENSGSNETDDDERSDDERSDDESSEDKQKMIQRNIRCSYYMKKKQIPKNEVEHSPFFYSTTYKRLIVREDFYSCLETIDSGALNFTKLTIV